MSWFHQGPCFSFLLWLTTLVILETPVRLAEEVKPEIHLAHICFHPEQCEYNPDAPVIMLHGLTDIKETYDGIYQDISSLTQRTVCVYDARNHGDSSWNDTFNIDVLAEDLEHFMNMMKIDRAVLVGHSMGGRTVMKFALNHPQRVDRFFVEDIGLKSIPETAVEAINFRIEILKRVLGLVPVDADEVTAKKAVVDHLQKLIKISNDSIPEHFVKYLPLRLRDGVWQWKTNFDVIKKVLKNPAEFFPKLVGGVYEGKAVFIYGATSIYRVGDQEDNIRKLFPNAHFVRVEGAGHHIHWKYPEYLKELFRFLKEPGANLAHICANLGSIPEEGVPVILLHEYASTKESWDGIYQNIPFLSHRRVCVYDARNHGDSPWNDTFTIDALAEDLESFMCAMKIEKAAFVGHGQGAYTAMRLALRNADKVERIFVEDVSPIDVPKEAIAGIEKYVTALRDGIREVPGDADEEAVREAIIKYVLQETEGIFQVPAESFPEEIPIRLKDGKWEWKMNIEVLMKPFDDPAAYLGKMEGRYDGKVFFIYGKESPYNVGRDVEAILKLFPNSEFLGIEGGGHFIHSEHRQFAVELLKFLH